MAQRLARRLCQWCREPYQPSYAELEGARWPFEYLATPEQLWRPVGCRSCANTGYRGRIALHEVMAVTEDVERLAVERASAHEIQRVAIDQGMEILRVDGLRKAMEGALELHEKWPANKSELAAKTGAPLRWKTPEEIPALQEKGKPRAVTSRNGCIHCHNVLEGGTKSLEAAKEPVPERDLAPYPVPQRVGLMLSTKERATVSSIDRNSPAEKAGIKEGDRVVRFGGQPILSWADVQWVLYQAKEADSIKVDLDRAGSPIEATLTLPAGWRVH
jgi:pyruvate-formate lyase-activating enzyme